MKTIELPELKFINWFKWENRTIIPNIQYPGVYLIAITNGNIENTYPKWQDVDYIGMSNSRGGLNSRWNQFNRSIRGKDGHSGGKTIYESLGDYSSWNMNLYVASMSMKCNTENPSNNDYIKMGLVAFFEYEAFALYYSETGGHPKFNKK